MNTRKPPGYSNSQETVKKVQNGRTATLTGVNEGKVGAGAVAVSMLLYTVARLGLVAAIAAIIFGIGWLVGVDVPLFVAAVFGVLIALPLGMFLFKPLRLRLNGQIAALDSERRQRHEDLQSRLNANDDN